MTKRLMRAGAVFTAFTALSAAAGWGSESADWPSWRGPQANGLADAKELAVEWSDEANVEWKTVLPGISAATPIVVGDRVFLNVGVDDHLELWSLDLGNGAVQWKRPLGQGNQTTRKQDMSSPSPVADAKRVIGLTGRGAVRGFSHSGEELWNRDLESEYGAFGLNWGYASSPLLVGDTCFIQVLHGARTDAPSYIIAINADTGENKWRVERKTDAQRESPDSYTTPVMVPRGDGWELVISGGDYVTGHDPSSGKEIWRVGGLNPEKRGMYRIVATPALVGETLLVPSRVSPLLALDMSGSGKPSVAWSLDRGTDVPSPTTDGKSIFIVDDRGMLRRFSLKTGESTMDPVRLAQGNYSASPIVAQGKLYVTSETGVTSVVDIKGEAKVLAENQIGGYVLSSLAVAGDRVLLRNDTALYSIVASK